MNLMQRILFLLLFCVVLPGTGAGAEDDVSLSLGMGFSADKTAYTKYDAVWSPRPIVNVDSERFYVSGFDAGLYLLKEEPVTVSAFVSYNDFSFSPSDSSDAKLRRLNKRYSTVTGGVEVGLLTPVGLFEARGAWDLLQQSDGFDCSLSWTGSLETGPVSLYPSLGVNWQSAGYLDYYYGVSGAEATKSGLEAYDAGPGWSPYAELAVDLRLTENWSVLLLLEGEMLSKSVRDSPMTDRDYTYGATTGLVYSF